MTLFTNKDFFAIFLIAVFILLQSVQPINKFTLILNVFFYSLFSITLLWVLYNSIFVNGLNNNLGLIIACAFAILAKIANPYIKKFLIKKFDTPQKNIK